MPEVCSFLPLNSSKPGNKKLYLTFINNCRYCSACGQRQKADVAITLLSTNLQHFKALCKRSSWQSEANRSFEKTVHSGGSRGRVGGVRTPLSLMEFFFYSLYYLFDAEILATAGSPIIIQLVDLFSDGKLLYWGVICWKNFPYCFLSQSLDYPYQNFLDPPLVQRDSQRQNKIRWTRVPTQHRWYERNWMLVSFQTSNTYAISCHPFLSPAYR